MNNSQWVKDKESKLEALEEKIPLISRNIVIDTEKNLKEYVAKGLVRKGTLLIATRKE